LTSARFNLLILAVTALVSLAIWFTEPVWGITTLLLGALLIAWLGCRCGVPKAGSAAEGAARSEASIRAEMETLLKDQAVMGRSQRDVSIAELNRVKDLLKQAIDQLVGSFNEMNSHIQSQRDLALSIIDSMTEDERAPEAPASRSSSWTPPRPWKRSWTTPSTPARSP
jgi:hypothetical protein